MAFSVFGLPYTDQSHLGFSSFYQSEVKIVLKTAHFIVCHSYHIYTTYNSLIC